MGWPRLPRRLNSFAVKLAAMVVIFAIVPALLHLQFDRAERHRHDLVLQLVQEQGRLVGESLFPLLDQFSARNVDRIDRALKHLARDNMSVKVLLRPQQSAQGRSFLLVASAPESNPAEAQSALARLIDSGVLAHLTASCEGQTPLSLRLPAKETDTAAEQELLTYLAPHANRLGCWVVLTAQGSGSQAERSIGRPYWHSAEIQFAASVYLLLAVLVISIFTDSWADIRRFRSVARAVIEARQPVSFATGNRIPELDEAARELDAMVASLRRGESLLRQAAEENAHALKAPLAVISQSLEPLRRAVPDDNARARRSLELIAGSVERLDTLVSTARRIDETIARLIDRPRHRVALSELLARRGAGYTKLAQERSVRLELSLAPGLVVLGSDEMIETIAENLLDNALDFSAAGSGVVLALAARGGLAVLSVTDQGPGVPDSDLERIFERHVSRRPDHGHQGGDHYGLGLWIVRRNAEAMGGRASAAAAAGGGLSVTVEIPLIR